MHWRLSSLCRALGIGATLAFLAACNRGTSALPTSPTEVVVAEPTVTETFAGTVTVGGSRFYSFSVREYGTVQVTLTAIGGAFVPATVMMGLGLGTPDGTDCVEHTSITTAAAGTPQLSGAYETGVHCVRIADIGNLFAPADFAITLAYP